MASDLTAAALIARAQALVLALRERAAEAEARRTLPPETIADLGAAGLLRVLRPKRHGGSALDLASFAEIVYALGRGCGATCWVYGAYAMNQLVGGLFPDAAQDDLWGAQADAVVASCLAVSGEARRTEGGYVLAGRWSRVSGVDYADWSVLGADIAETGGGPKDGILALVPRGVYDIDDDWDALGLAGSGSKSIVVKDTFVPEHRTVARGDAIASSGLGTAAALPAVAIAQGAFDDYVDSTRARTTRGAALGGARQMAEYATIQHRVAEASAALDAARLLIFRGLGAADGRVVTREQTERDRRDQSFAVRLALQAMDRLYESSGGQTLFNHNRVQRAWRDVHAASKLMNQHWDAVAARYGRFVFGLADA